MKHLLILAIGLFIAQGAALANDGSQLPAPTSSTQKTKSSVKNVTIRKTQSVDFEGDTVDGQARHPDGSYLVQKRSVDFIPLYKVRERFDENIKNSIDYLK
jgi:hypothetical protein